MHNIVSKIFLVLKSFRTLQILSLILLLLDRNGFVTEFQDAASGRAALALTFSMVPRTRHTKGEQNTPLLLPLKPNRGKANLASRIRTIEKSPRRPRPFARAPQLPRRPIKSENRESPKVFGVRPKNLHANQIFQGRHSRCHCIALAALEPHNRR